MPSQPGHGQRAFVNRVLSACDPKRRGGNHQTVGQIKSPSEERVGARTEGAEYCRSQKGKSRKMDCVLPPSRLNEIDVGDNVPESEDHCERNQQVRPRLFVRRIQRVAAPAGHGRVNGFTALIWSSSRRASARRRFVVRSVLEMLGDFQSDFFIIPLRAGMQRDR